MFSVSEVRIFVPRDKWEGKGKRKKKEEYDKSGNTGGRKQVSYPPG